MMKVDDTLAVFSTHGVAGLMGGLLTGVLANPAVIEYIGTGKDAPGVSGTGWAYGSIHQFVVQAEAAGFIIVFNIIATFDHPVRDQDLRAAPDGRSDAENRRRRRAWRNRLRHRRGRRVTQRYPRSTRKRGARARL